MEPRNRSKIDRRCFMRLAGLTGIAVAGSGLIQGCTQASAPAPMSAPTAGGASTAPKAAATAAQAVVPAKTGGTLTWGRAFKAASRDPHRIYGLQEMTLTRHFVEPLVELDPNGKLVPVLAESWKVSDDGKTWTFNLRKGVKFQDGTPFTAEAVKQTIQRVKGNAKSGFAFTFENYQDDPIRIVDDHTIELKTKIVDASVPYNLVPLYITPPEAGSNLDMTWEKGFGTGPFKLVEYDIDRIYRFEANPDYWRKGYPKVQTLIWKPVVEQSSLAAATKAGEFDLVDGLSPDNVMSLKNDANWEVMALPSWRLDFYIINQASSVAALKDPKVRQAMAYAIDREVIAKDVMQDMAAPWSTYPPKGILGASTKIPANAYDLNKARELMKQSAFPNGFEVTLKCPTGVSTHGKQKEVAQFVAQELSKIDIKMKIEEGEGPAIVAQYREGKYEIGYLSSVAVTGDPDRYFRERLYADTYKMSYSNDQVKKLIDDAVTATDENKRQAIYEDLQQKLWENMPIIYVQQTKLMVAKKKSVSGFVGMPNQVFHLTEVAKS